MGFRLSNNFCVLSTAIEKPETLEPIPSVPEQGTKWRHYKGGNYTVLMVARNCETPNTFFVVYQSDETREVWVRNLSNFLERNQFGNPRFERISE